MYANENDLAHGEFGKWLESIGMVHQHANRFMRITDELDAKYTTSCILGIEALYQIATMPEVEREKPQTIPSTGETKTVDEMTVQMVTRGNN